MADLKDTKKTLDETSESVKKLRDSISNLGDKKEQLKALEDSFKSINKSIGDIDTEKITKEFTGVTSAFRALKKEIQSGNINTSSIDNYIKKIDILNNKIASVKPIKLGDKESNLVARFEQVDKIISTYIDAFKRVDSETKKSSYVGETPLENIIKDADVAMSSLNALRQVINDIKIGKSFSTSELDAFNEKLKTIEASSKGAIQNLDEGLKVVTKSISENFTRNVGSRLEPIFETGYLKERLNEYAASFKDVLNMKDSFIQNDAVFKYINDFIYQNDRLENSMAQLTRYGKERGTLDKALGFKITDKDVAKEIAEKELYLRELNTTIIQTFGLSGINDKVIYNNPDFKDYRDDIQNTTKEINRLESSVGKAIPGFIDLNNQAATLARNAQFFTDSGALDMLSKMVIPESAKKQIYGDYDWSKLSIEQFYKINKKANEGTIENTNNEIKAVGENAKQSEKSVGELNTKVKELENSGNKDILGDNIKKSDEEVKQLSDKTKELLKNTTALNESQKSEILGKNYFDSSRVDAYTNKIQELATAYKNIEEANKLNYQKPFVLDTGNASDISILNNYKSEIGIITESLKELRAEQQRALKDLNSLSERGKIEQISTWNLPGYYVNELANVRAVLESGYRTNLIKGSEDYNKLMNAEKEYNQLLSTFSNVKITGLNVNLANETSRFEEAQREVNKVLEEQAKKEKAILDYEKNKAEYAKAVRNAAQQQINKSDLEYLSKNIGLIDTKKIERKNAFGETINKSDRDLVLEAINRTNSRYGYGTSTKDLENEFKKYGLEIPQVDTSDITKNNLGSFLNSQIDKIKSIKFGKTIGELNKLEEKFKSIAAEAGKYGVDITSVSNKLNTLGTGVKNAFNSDDISKAIPLLEQYKNEINSLNNKVASQKANQKQIYEQTKDYVRTQEILNNQKMPYKAQAAYYSQQLQQLTQGTKEYIEVLGLLRNAESKYNEQLNSKKSQQDLLRQNKNNILSQITGGLSERDSILKGLDTTGLDKVTEKIRIIRKELDKALMSGDAGRAASLWDAYVSATDKVIGRSNAVAEAQKRQADTQKQLLDEISNYVRTQEILNNQKIPYADQAAYYNQQLQQLKQGTREYIEVLNLKQQAEKNAAQAAQDAIQKQINTVRQVAQAVNNAVNNIIKAIRTVISVITKITSVVATVVKTVISGIQKILTLLGNLGDRIKSLFTGVDKGAQVNNVFGSIGLSATELRSKLLLLKGAFDALFNNELIQKAKDLLGSIYSMRTIVGANLTQGTIDWANNMERAFGLNASSLIADLKEINGVLYGLGMSSEDTAIGSKNLLMMSRYLASIGLAGGDANTVMSKIVSGMKGMTASIDDLGLSVRDAQMNAFLKDLKAQGGEFAKLKTDFSSMNEQARVYVRYAALIQQFTSKYDITKMVNGMNTVTGRLGMVKDYWNELLTQMGTGLAVVVSKLSAVIIKIIQTLQSWVQGFFSLFGIDVKLGLDLNNQVGGIKDASDAVSDMNSGLEKTDENLNNVANSADKAKGSLQGFDRINNVTSSSSGGASGAASGLDDFDYSSLMTNMLEELDKMADEAAQSFTDKIWEEFKDGAKKAYDDFIEYAKKKTGRQDFDLGFDFKKIEKNLKNIKKYIEGTIKNWGNFFIEIGLKIMDDINIGQIITDITTLAASFAKLAYVVSDVLTVALMNFYDIGLSPIVKYIGEVVSGAINKVTEQFDKWSNWFAANAPLINNFFITLGEVVAEAFSIVKPYIDGLLESIGKIFDSMNESARNKLVEFMQGFIENKDETIAYLGEAIPNAIDKVKEAFSILRGILDPLVSIVADLAKSFGEFLKEEGLPWLTDKLKDLGDWLNKHKDDIIELIKMLANTAWDGFKIFVDLVGKLVTFAVEHPGVVVALFAGLSTIKAASWFTDTAGGIAQMVFQLKLLKSLGGIKSILTGGAAVSTAASTASTATSTAAGGAAGSAAGGSALAGGALAAPFAIAGGVGVLSFFANENFFSDNFNQAIENINKMRNESQLAAIDFLALRDKANEAASRIRESYNNVLKEDQLLGVLENVRIQLESTGLYTQEQVQKQLETFEQYLYDAGVEVESSYGASVEGLLSKSEEFKQNVIDNHIQISSEITDASNESAEKIQEGINEASQGSTDLKNTVTQNNSTIKTSNESLTGSTEGVVGGFKSASQESTGLKNTVTQNNNTIKTSNESLTGSTEGVTGGFKSASDQMNKLGDTTPINRSKSALDKLKDVLDTIGTYVGKIISGITGLPGTIGGWIGSIPDKLFGKEFADGGIVTSPTPGIFGEAGPEALIPLGKDKRTTGLRLWKEAGSILKASYNDTVKRTSMVKAAPITAHANGGSIAGGQLFIANEGGGAELIGNIDGTRKTNVANNQMITDAIYEAVYNAMADVHDQSVKSTPAGNKEATININGFGIIDRATLSELARLLAPYLGANSLNVANNNFSI